MECREFQKLDLAYKAASTQGASARLIVFAPGEASKARIPRFLRFDGKSFEACAEAYDKYARAHAGQEFQEVIFGDEWHRIAFDLDHNIDEDHRSSPADYARMLRWFREAIDALVDAAIDSYFEAFDDVITREDFIVCESNDEHEPARLSAHVIINRAVPNYRASAHLTDLVIKMMPVGMGCIVDRSLNASRHNLRIAGCAKIGSCRVKMIPRNKRLIDTLVMAPALHICDEKADFWDAQMESAAARVPSSLQVIMPGDAVSKACALIDKKYGAGAHTYRGSAGSIISFNRRRSTMCDLCKRKHDHDNTVIVQVSTFQGKTQYKELCRRNMPVKASPSGADASASVASLVLDTTCNDGIDGALANAPIIAPAAGTWESRIKANSYTEPNMRDYPPEYATLFIRAPMKLGKTKALRRFITNHVADEQAKIIFISFRRTFSASVAQKFQEFSMYTEISGPLDANKMIVQVESLHRIDTEKLGPIDLLILDESESIIEQFDSGLSANRGTDLATFRWLLQSAKRCIALDAFMTERTYAVIGRIRGVDDALAIANKYKNATNDNYYFTANREQWLMALLECTRKKEKIAVCVNSANEGRTLFEILKKDMSPSSAGAAPVRIKFYCAETSARVKTDDFSDVDSAWVDCDILIYTPTLTAGVSFEREHFDSLFGYFTDRSCGAQSCIQMMGRIRNIKNHRMYICLKTSDGSFPETREEMVMCLRLRKNAIASSGDMPEIEFTREGLPTIPDNDYSELKIQNAIVRNRSRNHFKREIIAMIAEPGAKCSRLTAQVHAAIFGHAPSLDDLRHIREEHALARGEITARAAQAVASARDLTGEEFEYLAKIARTQKTSDFITDEDRAAVRKYEMRQTYGRHDKEISPAFVETFANPQIMTAYDNLSMLCNALASNGKDISRAMAEMRRADAEKMRAYDMSRTAIDDAQDYKFTCEVHRLAHLCARTLGFDSVLDSKVRAMCDVEKSIDESRERIEKMWSQLCARFKIAPTKDYANPRVFIDIAQSIFAETYGITLSRMGKLAQLSLGKMFRIMPNGRLSTNI